MYDYFSRQRQVQKIIEAHDVLERAPMSYEEAVEEAKRLDDVARWLQAESHWRHIVTHWLAAEKKWELTQYKFQNATYAAAKRGWNVIKQYVPTQDGVASFEQLPDSLQFRYAAFAAGVLELLPPPEVRSTKQGTLHVT